MTPQRRRAEINKENSQHSTGPKTEAGKQRFSLNALRHGLTGQIVGMPTEDLRAYQSHLKSFTDEYGPDGFVFSETEINAPKRARKREHLAVEAYDHEYAAA